MLQKSVRFIVATFMLLVPLSLAHADESWVVARSKVSGGCSLQSADGTAILGEELVKGQDKRAACEAAKSLWTQDQYDSTHCQGYTPNTVAMCQKQGITLTP
jgi:hypothetical protein